jgi:hypothetical protein
MKFAGLAMLLLLLAGCAAQPRARDAGAQGAARRTDMYCMDDCVGNGGTSDFCRERCTD